MSKESFLSSSWDGCVKIWRPELAQSVTTLPIHNCTYSAQFSPHSANIVSAVSSDSRIRVFDMRTKASASNHLVMEILIHAPPLTRPGIAPAAAMPEAEALTHDWNKYRDTVLATGGVDRMIRTFDIRAPNQGPVAVLQGHEFAIRRLTWSPHLSDVLLSASYDMTCRVWTDGSAVGTPGAKSPVDTLSFGDGRQLGRMDRHTEFATGVDWCLFGNEGWCASCGWDERVLVWDVRAVMR